MQVVLNEKKCKDNGYDYHEVQHFLNKNVRSIGVTKKVGLATWQCNDNLVNKMFGLVANLVDLDWLVKVVDHIFVWEKVIDDDHKEDALATHRELCARLTR